MGRIFYKQPNGLMTIFSTNSDRPIYWNVNKEDYINLKLEEYKEQLERDAKEIFDDEDPYYVKDFDESYFGKSPNIKVEDTYKEKTSNFMYNGIFCSGVPKVISFVIILFSYMFSSNTFFESGPSFLKFI